MHKEKNFISAVVYLQNDEQKVEPFFDMLYRQLSARFEYYEVVCVNDGCKDKTVEKVKAFCAAKDDLPVTIVNMSLSQGLELAMNAGLDMAIGDFVYEFDTLNITYPEELILEVYDKALTGFDIVGANPGKSRNLFSRLFYSLFNWASPSPYPLQTEAFRLISRRGINRVHAISGLLYYRKAAYAASGLKVTGLVYTPVSNMPEEREQTRFTRAIDSLALYTNTGYKLSFYIAAAMLALTLFEVLYTVYVYFFLHIAVAGWATTMLVISAGFFGLFLILTLAMKYLSLLLELVFKNQKYLVEGIEKLQK